MAPKVPFLAVETETLHLINSMPLTDFGMIGIAAFMFIQYLLWNRRCGSRKVVLPASAMSGSSATASRERRRQMSGSQPGTRVLNDIAITASGQECQRPGADRL